MSASILSAAMLALKSEDLSCWTGKDVFDFISWADGYSDMRADLIGQTPDRVVAMWSAITSGYEWPETPHIESVSSELERRRRRWQDRRSRIAPLVFSRDGGVCALCGQPAVNATVDHIVPLSRGGSDDLDNLQTACSSCNSRKGARV